MCNIYKYVYVTISPELFWHLRHSQEPLNHRGTIPTAEVAMHLGRSLCQAATLPKEIKPVELICMFASSRSSSPSLEQKRHYSPAFPLLVMFHSHQPTSTSQADSLKYDHGCGNATCQIEICRLVLIASSHLSAAAIDTTITGDNTSAAAVLNKVC